MCLLFLIRTHLLVFLISYYAENLKEGIMAHVVNGTILFLYEQKKVAVTVKCSGSCPEPTADLSLTNEKLKLCRKQRCEDGFLDRLIKFVTGSST